jgi:hypothetical protein
MKDFITAYYTALPDHPADAWTKLDQHFQEQTGQAAFLSFCATIQSVTVVSINPRDATSVTAGLTYIRKNGNVVAEDRWLRMSSANSVLQLYESERIGSVAAHPMRRRRVKAPQQRASSMPLPSSTDNQPTLYRGAVAESSVATPRQRQCTTASTGARRRRLTRTSAGRPLHRPYCASTIPLPRPDRLSVA